jgi:hypothetical protein
VWPNSGIVNLGALPTNGSVGFEINNAGGSIDPTGYGLSMGAGYDVNGDGIADIILDNYQNPQGNDGMITLFGKSGWPASNSFSVTSINGTNGAVMDGSWSGLGMPIVAYNYTKWTTPVDINGYGIEDITGECQGLVAACNGNWGYFVAFGPPTGSWASPSSAAFTGTNGFTFCPTQLHYNNQAFYPQSTAGDVNGDGIADLVVTDYTANSNAGAVYIVKGGVSNYNNGLLGPSDLSTYGYQINGANAGDAAGTYVGVGDLDHDGTQDMIIAAPGASPGGKSGAGSVYVIWGSKSLPPTLNLSNVQ